MRLCAAAWQLAQQRVLGLLELQLLQQQAPWLLFLLLVLPVPALWQAVLL